MNRRGISSEFRVQSSEWLCERKRGGADVWLEAEDIELAGRRLDRNSQLSTLNSQPARAAAANVLSVAVASPPAAACTL